MNILLVEPETPRAWGSNQQYIGLLKIGAYHKAIGDHVEYIQGCCLPQTEPDLVYVTSMFTYWYRKVWEVVRYYKQHTSAKILLGGIYATICPEHARLSGADEVVVGQYTEAKEYPPDVTLLPKLPEFAYCMTSYGCSGNCTFCATHVLYGYGNPVQREIESIIREIKLQKNRGVKNIYFGDDDIGFNSENHLTPLLERIIAENLKLDFYIYGGIQSRSITPELATLMKRARIRKLSLGFESVDEEILRRMGRTKLGGTETLNKALRCFKDVGYRLDEITVFFMIGLPYQKLRDMVNTLAHLLSVGVWAEPQRWAPIPNTPDYNSLGLEKYDLEDLYYKKFVAPNQTEFTHGDLEHIYKIARFFNIGRRYTSFDPLDLRNTVSKIFWERLLTV